jgi:cytochrome P450
MDNTTLFVFSSVAFLSLLLWRTGRRGNLFPPGPPTKPLIGNIHQFPKSFLQLQFSAWAKEYGEVFSLKVINHTMIVASSPAAVKEIFDKQGTSTGGRPRGIMSLTTDKLYMILEDMNTVVWHRARKAMQPLLSSEAISRHLPTHEAEAIQLLNDLSTSPEDLYTHIMRTTSSITSSLLYGKRFPKFAGSDSETYYVGIRLAAEAGDVAKYPPIEFLPWLEYLPQWLAPWTNHCDRMKRVRNGLYDGLLKECEEKMMSGKGTGSFLETLLSDREGMELSWREISFIGAALMDGGGETSASFLHGFILTLLSYTDCQRRIWAEIDQVVGNTRLPNPNDYEKLPYLQAVINEVHRFRPLLPLSIPHKATEDIEYGGYVIPKGAMLFQNTWGIMHDPTLFEEPENFRPERFLKTKYGTKPGVDVSNFRGNFFFGAGRRICPGEKMGRRTTELTAMYLVWAYEFKPLPGKFFDLDMDRYIKPGLDLAPKSFVCDVKVRSEGRARVIKSASA